MIESFGLWSRGGDVHGARGWCKRASCRVALIRHGEKMQRAAFKREIAQQVSEYLHEQDLLAREDEAWMWDEDEEALAAAALDLRYAAWDYEYARLDEDMTELEHTYPVWLLMRAGWYSTWSQSDEWAA